MSTIIHRIFPLSRTCQNALVRRVAFDIGSEQIKMQVSDVNLLTNQIVRVLLTDCAFVKLREDLSNSSKQNLSAGIQNKTVEAIAEFVQKAAPFKPEAYHAVATEALRIAKNSEDLVTRIENETHVSTTIISQEEEGILGFMSAASRTHIDQEKIVVWDWGSGSFQITTKCHDKYSVYQGRLGTVPIKIALLKIQGKVHGSKAKLDPISEKESVQAMQFIKKNLHNIPLSLIQKLKSPDTVVLGIGIHPLWGMPNNEAYDQKRISTEMNIRLNHEKTEDSAYTLCNLIFAHTVMQTLGIKQVQYVATPAENAVGTLLMSKYWE